MQTGGNIVDELERNPSHHRQMLYNNKIWQRFDSNGLQLHLFAITG
jgi:hypothetical protein